MSLQERIHLCKEYTKLWSDFFKTFADGLDQKKVLVKEEKIFNQMVHLLAMKHYEFTEMMENKLPDPDGILEVLSDAVSIQHLKELSEAQFSKLQVNWHTQFIAMNKCLGKLLIELPIDKRAQHQYIQEKASQEQKKATPQTFPPEPSPSPQRK